MINEILAGMRIRKLSVLGRIMYIAAVVAFSGTAAESSDTKVDRLVLISLDGVRTQEIFQGLDVELLMKSNQDMKKEDHPLYRMFHGGTPEESRARIMPFFWNEWVPGHGVVMGNRHASTPHPMTLVNRRRFSYPGYSEILTGAQHDREITSNDKIQNPFPTVLDVLKREWNLAKEDVAVFASWDVFPYISTRESGSIFVNAGYQPYPFSSARLDLLNQAMFEQPTPWDSVRHDFTTFSFAMDYLERKSPRVLYLSLGETDDWAHMDNYEKTLTALHRTDSYLKQLWEYLQSNPNYRNRTGIILCTDHGRGDNIYNWMSHNDKLPGAQYVWMAAFSPNISHRGEWNPKSQPTQSQIAATWCAMAGFNLNNHIPASGQAIDGLLEISE